MPLKKMLLILWEVYKLHTLNQIHVFMSWFEGRGTGMFMFTRHHVLSIIMVSIVALLILPLSFKMWHTVASKMRPMYDSVCWHHGNRNVLVLLLHMIRIVNMAIVCRLT